MDFREILEIIAVVSSITGLGLLFFFYFTNENVKLWVDRILDKVPVGTLLNIAASKVEDTKGVFDTHDSLKVAARLADYFRDTINDPTNISFEDVEDEVFAFLNTELDRYRNAGVRGVPDLSDVALRTSVEVVFEQIKRALSEDSTGNYS